MEQRIMSVETELELLKQEMADCQRSIQKDIAHLKATKQDIPQWLRNSAAAIIIAIFGQVITTIWWASSITANQVNMQKEIGTNTEFRMDFPKLHQEVMVELGKLRSESSHRDEELDKIKSIIINKLTGGQ